MNIIMVNKKLFLTIVFVFLCSMRMMAQTDYYYYKDKKMPLINNNTKICVSISKDNKDTSKRIRANVQILDTIRDETFDTFIIRRSDFKKLTALDSWEDDSKSVILTSSYYTKNNKEVFASPYFYVKLKKEEDMDLLTSYAEKYRLNIVKQDSYMPLWYILAVTKDCDKNVLECVNSLWESGEFAASEPDLCAKNLTYSDDPLFNQQWGLHNGHHPDIDISVDSAWNNATGRNIKIAIIDTSIDTSHSDLASNIGSLSYNTEAINSPSQINIFDSNYAHGTHCAGIAAAVKDNNIQIAGVAPDATIVPISNSLSLSEQNSSNLANGINWACGHDVDVISCSWGAITNLILEDAIQNALTNGRHGKGCVVVFAAGNKYQEESSYDVRYPANCNDKILVVGAIDSTGVRLPNSCYGTELDLVAPGDNILSTIPFNITGRKSGTSMACPHVAGVAALILERNSELTVDQVNSIICSNTKKKPNQNYYTETKPYGSWSNQYGYGLVNADSAVTNTPSDAYIQNETITGTRIITADNVYVGTDVTDTKPYGDVVLDQGDITIKAGYVEIEGSTTISLGTTLTI